MKILIVFLIMSILFIGGCSSYCENDDKCMEKQGGKSLVFNYYKCINNKCVDVCSFEGYCIFDMTTTPEKCNYTLFGGGVCKCTESESWCAKIE